MNKKSGSTTSAAAVPEIEGRLIYSELGFSATFFDCLPVEILIVEETGGIVAANEPFRQRFGNKLGLLFQHSLLNDDAEIEDHLKIAVDRDFHSFEVIYNSAGSIVPQYRIDTFRMNGKIKRAALVHRPITRARFGSVLPDSEEGSLSHRDLLNDEMIQVREFFSLFSEENEYEITHFEPTVSIPTNTPLELQIEEILDRANLVGCFVPRGIGFGHDPAESRSRATFGECFQSRKIAAEVARLFVESNYLLSRMEIVETTTSGKQIQLSTSILGFVEKSRLVRIWMAKRDITVLKHTQKAYSIAEGQLRRYQRIEPIGRLAGGIAHDFNNFLGVILLQVEMMRQEIEENSPLQNRISEILRVTDTAANLVKQLLAFGRKQTMQPCQVILSDVVTEFIKMASGLIGEDIEIRVDLDPEIGVCFVDPNQITQILMNLSVNAMDAMPDGGILKIATKNLTIDKITFKHRAQPKGEYIELSVEDTGCGMDQMTQKHAFNPFFTTKDPQKGTGLGLATVYGIVKQSNGFIWIDSKIGRGTRFSVQFPRTYDAAKGVETQKSSSIPHGTETILLVEDEEMIRRTSVEALKSLGYDIIEARDGVEAMKLVAEFDGKIDLLLTDVVMPRMNGRDLANKVKRIHPDLSVLFMSGYAADIITNHPMLEDDVHFLGKPFSPLTLAEHIRKAVGD